MLLEMLFALEPKAASSHRHASPLSRDVRLPARGRGAVRHDDRGLRGPVAGGDRGDARREALGDEARSLPRDREGRAARPRPRRSRRLDHRHSPRPVADARERAEDRLGRAARAMEGESARGLERRHVLGVHPRAWLPYNPLHDRGYDSIGDTHSTLPGAGRSGRWSGTEGGVRHPHGGLGGGRKHRRRGAVSGFVVWFTGLSAAGKTTVGTLVARARGPRSDRRRAGRRRRAHASLQGLGYSKETATSTSPASAGSPRVWPAPVPPSWSARSPLRGDAPPRPRARRGERPVRRDPRRDAARGLRRARPEGPLQASARGRDRAFHRRLGSVRDTGEPELRLHTEGREPAESAAAVVERLEELWSSRREAAGRVEHLRARSPTSTISRRRRSTSSASSLPSSSARYCSSRAARTRSCSCGSPRRRSVPASSPSRSCMSTRATTSPR